MPETPNALDQGCVVGFAGSVVLDAVWRQAQDRALAALEMPGIVVVLGPADLGRFFLRDLMVGLRECGRAVTFPRADDLPEPPPLAGSALIFEDAAQMDGAMLEAICRAPDRRVVLFGLSASALAELPVPLTPSLLTVVTFEPLSPAALRSSTSKARLAIESGVLASALAKLPAPRTIVPLEPLSPGTAAAPRPSPGNVRMAIAIGVLAATCAAGALVWTPRAPPAPVRSRVAALQPAVELPPVAGFPPAPPEPAISASEQPVDATSAASPAPMPTGGEDRPDIDPSLERPRVPVIAQPGPRSDSEPAPPQLQTSPSPVPESRQALNVPPAAAIATLPRASSASDQPGDATSAALPAPLPAGYEDRPGIGTSLERPAVPMVTQTGPRSGSGPASPQLQARPAPGPESRETLNLPPSTAIAPPPLAEVPRSTPPEPAAPSGSAPQVLPENAPIRVLVSYPPRSAAARQEAGELVRLLRSGGLAASDPAPAARVAGKAGITYFFAEDRDGARRVEHDLGEGFGPSRLSPVASGALPRPGTIEVLVPAR